MSATYEGQTDFESVVEVGGYFLLPTYKYPPIGVYAGDGLDMSPYTWRHFDGPLFDPMFTIMHRMFVNFGFQSTKRMIGFPFADRGCGFDVAIPGYKPQTALYNPSLDYARHNSLATNLKFALHPNVYDPFGVRDHEVRHSQFSGSVRNLENPPLFVEDGVLSADPYPPFNFTYPAISPNIGVTNGVPQEIDVSSPFPFTGEVSGYAYTNIGQTPRTDARLVFESLAHQGRVEWIEGSHSLVYLDISSWKYQATERRHYLSYSYGVMTHAVEHYDRLDQWKVSMILSIDLGDRATDEWGYGIFPMKPYPLYPIQYFCSDIGTREYWEGVETDWRIPTSSRSVGIESTLLKRCFLSQPSTDNSEILQPSDFATAFELWRHPWTLDLRYRDLGPSCYFSTMDAVDQFSSTLDNNYLEDIADLSGILEIVPDIPMLVRALVDIKRGKLSGVVRLGDFLTELYLRLKFEILPDSRAIAELNEKGQILIDGFNRLEEVDRYVFYGKFTFDLPDAYVPNSSSNYLVTRSKVVFRMSDSSFIIALLKLNRSGLAPTLSNLWEVLPGSFIVDWFFRIGRRIQDVENSGLLLALEIESFVHSYEITSTIPEEKLSSLGLTSPNHDFAYRYYVRHLSVRVPTGEGSKFDFRQPSMGPDAGIVGSLLWQVFLA